MTRQGEPMEWIRDQLGRSSDDCIRWPFAKSNYAHIFYGGRSTTAHRVVCELAHGPAPTAQHQAAHDCGNRFCVNPRHLSWKTPIENNRDKLRHGTAMFNDKNHRTKLSVEDVRAIRSMAGRVRVTRIARLYGVSSSHVSGILSGRERTHAGPTNRQLALEAAERSARANSTATKG